MKRRQIIQYVQILHTQNDTIHIIQYDTIHYETIHNNQPKQVISLFELEMENKVVVRYLFKSI